MMSDLSEGGDEAGSMDCVVVASGGYQSGSGLDGVYPGVVLVPGLSRDTY